MGAAGRNGCEDGRPGRNGVRPLPHGSGNRCARRSPLRTSGGCRLPNGCVVGYWSRNSVRLQYPPGTGTADVRRETWSGELCAFSSYSLNKIATYWQCRHREGMKSGSYERLFRCSGKVPASVHAMARRASRPGSSGATRLPGRNEGSCPGTWLRSRTSGCSDGSP